GPERMNDTLARTLDPALDLVLTRRTDLPVEQVWRAWTTPELLVQWFTPKPWKTPECELDLYPGGRFYTLMESPEGEQFPGESCVLEVVENRRFVWTSALLPGYRPKAQQPDVDGEEMFPFTAVIEMEPDGSGTRYTATAIHPDRESCRKHGEMGFETGWGAAFDQLVELMKSQARP
ncbi:MAG TPA: SRPBCC family protein, partial [Fimbriimonas sp.]